MVSFFFTPIYMFILVFLVFFGTKKGTLSSYQGTWLTTFIRNLQILRSINLHSIFIFKTTYRFQHTAITARSTVYLLTCFWLFFFFFGESLLLLTLNYNTLVDLIASSVFSFTKSHVLFMTESSNSFLSDTLFYFISFLASVAFIFLLNLRYVATYNYTSNSTILDLFGICVILNATSFLFFFILVISVSLISRPKLSL
jgi:hypothetical protein